MTHEQSVDDMTPHRRLPAWVMSVVLHAVGLIVLALLLRPAQRGAVGEPDRTVGIALVKTVDGEREYFDQQSAASASASEWSSRNELIGLKAAP